jgi:hypothetical protein
MEFITRKTNQNSLVLYKMPNKKTQRKVGSRAKVFHGGAEKTVGGLTKDDLIKNKHGRIVSKKKHETMRKKTES